MEPRKLIQIPAQVVDFRPRADRSYRISFETRELAGEDLALLADNYQGEGYLVYKPNGDVAPDDIPDGRAEAGLKSPQQRLRARIYILWKQKGGRGDFDSYYRTSIEKLIEYIDAQLTERS